MTRTLVIGSSDSGSKNDPSAIVSALNAAGNQAEVWFWEDLVFDISAGHVEVSHKGVPLTESGPDLVIAVGWYKNGTRSLYRDVAYTLALYLSSLNVEFWNSEMAAQRSTSKLSCMMKLALCGIPVPRTIFSLTQQHMNGYLTVPCIVKAVSASRGASNYLVRSEAHFAELMADDVYYIAQPFMENNHDLRVICFGGKPGLILRRARAQDAGSHLNNTSQGARAEWLGFGQVPDALLTNAAEICKIMNRELSGIDYIPDPLSPFGYACLEVNAVPQLTSGFDSAKKLQALAESIARKGDT